MEEGGAFVRLPSELPPIEDFERDITRYAESENSAWFVAKRAYLVGALQLTGGALARTRHAAHFTVMVDPQFRRQGIARALLTHALDWARENPMLTRVALSVFADNTAAISLYRDLGFVEEGRLVGAYRDADGTLRDDLRMGRAVE